MKNSLDLLTNGLRFSLQMRIGADEKKTKWKIDKHNYHDQRMEKERIFDLAYSQRALSTGRLIFSILECPKFRLISDPHQTLSNIMAHTRARIVFLHSFILLFINVGIFLSFFFHFDFSIFMEVANSSYI